MTDDQQPPELQDIAYFVEAITQVINLRAPDVPARPYERFTSLSESELRALAVHDAVLQNVMSAVFMALVARNGIEDAAAQYIHFAASGQARGIQLTIQQPAAPEKPPGPPPAPTPPPLARPQ